MNRMVSKWAARRAGTVPDPKKKVAVMVPLPSADLSYEEEVSMRQLRKHLDSHDKFLLVPEGMEVGFEGFRVLELERRHFGSAANHNRMLYRTDFWEKFSDYEYVLMYHLDALVFSDRLLEWCDKDLDYIGAPFLKSVHTPWVETERVGNGGFALYRVRSVLRVLWGRYRDEPAKYWEDRFWKWIEIRQRLLRPLRAAVPTWLRGRATAPLQRRLRQMDHIEINERGNDLFWSDQAKRYLPEFKVGSLEQGLDFAFETEPKWSLERNGGRIPFGCHAWGRYDRGFWENYLGQCGEGPGENVNGVPSEPESVLADSGSASRP